jgi:hypothetical protein
MKGFSIMTFGCRIGQEAIEGVLRKKFFELYEKVKNEVNPWWALH